MKNFTKYSALQRKTYLGIGTMVVMTMQCPLGNIDEEIRNVLETWLENHYTELSRALEATPWNRRLKSVDVEVEYSDNSCRVARKPVLVYTPNFQLGTITTIQGCSGAARDALIRLFDIRRKDCLLANLVREISNVFSDHNIAVQSNRIRGGLLELLTYLFEVDVESLREPPTLIQCPSGMFKIKCETRDLGEILSILNEVLGKFTARLMLPGNYPVRVTSLAFVKPQKLAADKLSDKLAFENCIVHKIDARTITMAVLAASGHALPPSPIPDVDFLSLLENLCIKTTFTIDLQPDPRRWSKYEANCLLHNEALKRLRKAIGLLKVHDPDMVIINAIYHVDSIWLDSPRALRTVTRISSGLVSLGGPSLAQPSGAIVNSKHALFFSPTRKERIESWDYVKEAFEKLNELSRPSDRRLAEALKVVLVDLAREHETLSIEEK